MIGGLPAISRYDVERHWYLHELRRVRIVTRLNREFPKTLAILVKEVKEYQRELCNLRKKRNV